MLKVFLTFNNIPIAPEDQLIVQNSPRIIKAEPKLIKVVDDVNQDNDNIPLAKDPGKLGPTESCFKFDVITESP